MSASAALHACSCGSAYLQRFGGEQRRSSGRTIFAPRTCGGKSRRRSARATAMAAAAEEELKKGVAEFYDESTRVWEDIWGDHLHHGFYDPHVAPPSSIDSHRSAQFRMIEEALRFAALQDDSENKPKSIVDVGCGIGGSSRYLAKKYEAKCVGISLSPIQVQRAQELTIAQGLADTVSVISSGRCTSATISDGQFDLVWSMESGEHMPDKMKFVSELVRVAAPGATIIIVTWCHRNLSPDEASLQPHEEELLKRICNAFYLPKWCSAADYVKLLESMSMEDIKSADWSDYVAPFWPAVIRSALTWKGFFSLLRSVVHLILILGIQFNLGWKTIKGALVMPLMIKGYKSNLIKFAIITCKKPE
ncbi:hypothetical protein Syun_017999 [Stephania yunnanensis]|uniref:Methyltransferase type 11 domain-containing protein n=1 Tax=Stephania yunnanensis TaxID=152371 RepID=A0AAP0NUL5_9MAGN